MKHLYETSENIVKEERIYYEQCILFPQCVLVRFIVRLENIVTRGDHVVLISGTYCFRLAYFDALNSMYRKIQDKSFLSHLYILTCVLLNKFNKTFQSIVKTRIMLSNTYFFGEKLLIFPTV